MRDDSRSRLRVSGVSALFSAVCLWTAAAAAEGPAVVRPLPRAHAHNDYEHPRPLLDALDHGFCSVEADVWLVDGRLLVAHERKQVRPERTLQSLYLDPLRERAERNGGRIHPGGPPVTLLVDIKSDATNTYRALVATLKPYATMLTQFGPDRTEPRAVSAILSGNRSRGLVESEPFRHLGFEGRPEDMAGTDTPQFMPLISDNWSRHFKWRGAGPLPEDERSRLRELAGRAHAQGRRIRFWNIPDTPAGWSVVMQAGVDLVNTDNLSGFRDFCLAGEAPAAGAERAP